MPFLRHCLATALLASAFLLPAPNAQAATFQVEIMANVTSNPLFIFGTHASEFTPGEAIEITLTFDNGLPDGAAEAGTGIFVQSISQLDVFFPGSGLTFLFGNPLSSMGTSDDVPQGNDSIAFSSSSRLGGDLLGGAVPTSISVSLLQLGAPGPPATLIVNDRLTTDPFTFTEANFTVITGTSDFTQLLIDGGGATPEQVPEPAAALLLASLLPAAARARRR